MTTPIASVLIVLTVSFLCTRLATVALTLTGLSRELASNVAGVLGATNMLTVVPTVSVSDEASESAPAIDCSP